MGVSSSHCPRRRIGDRRTQQDSRTGPGEALGRTDRDLWVEYSTRSSLRTRCCRLGGGNPLEPFGGAARGAGWTGPSGCPGSTGGAGLGAGGPAHGLAASVDPQRAQHRGWPVGPGPWKRGISPLRCRSCGQEAPGLCPAAGPAQGAGAIQCARKERKRRKKSGDGSRSQAADKPHPARPAYQRPAPP